MPDAADRLNGVGNGKIVGIKFDTAVNVAVVSKLLEKTPKGLYCPAGNFFVDPTAPVESAVVSHAHTDHARPGCKRYLATSASETLLKLRLNLDARLTFLPFGDSVNIGGVKVSFHPAGHILGSAQVRLEYKGFVAVVTGDYKLGHDPTCAAWSPIRCNLMVTESTFGLPVYRWRPDAVLFKQINDWWRSNSDAGLCSILYGYAVGKSQRLLAGIDASTGPIYTHGAVEKGTQPIETLASISPLRIMSGLWIGNMISGDLWCLPYRVHMVRLGCDVLERLELRWQVAGWLSEVPVAGAQSTRDLHLVTTLTGPPC